MENYERYNKVSSQQYDKKTVMSFFCSVPSDMKLITFIREIENNGGWNQPFDRLHKAWELVMPNLVLRMERYGNTCGWSSIKIKKDGKEVYKRVRGETEQRDEFFFEEHSRTYHGDQFSFIEYLFSNCSIKLCSQNNKDLFF